MRRNMFLAVAAWVLNAVRFVGQTAWQGAVVLALMVKARQERYAALVYQTMRRFGHNHQAALNTAGIVGIVFAILSVVITVLLIAGLIPTFFNATEDVVTTFNDPNETTGDATADSLLPTFALVIAIVAVLAIFGLIVAKVKFGK